ncbi:MAG: alpha-1,4-glucan--maltose-1-phosphate maltosyltransferase, partial [Flavobacteriaceae bacterium]
VYVISKLNAARKAHASFQQTNNIRFCTIENDRLIAFYKWNDDRSDETLTVINLDNHYAQRGTVQLPLHEMGVQHGQPLEMHDLITNNSYIWREEWNFVEIHPALPFHVFHIKK